MINQKAFVKRDGDGRSIRAVPKRVGNERSPTAADRQLTPLTKYDFRRLAGWAVKEKIQAS